MLRDNLYHFLSSEAIDNYFAIVDKLIKSLPLFIINQFRNHKIHGMYLVWQITYRLQQTDAKHVNENICVVDYYLHYSDKLKMIFYAVNRCVQQNCGFAQ